MLALLSNLSHRYTGGNMLLCLGALLLFWVLVPGASLLIAASLAHSHRNGFLE